MSILNENISIKIKGVSRMSWNVSYVDVAKRNYHALVFRISGCALFSDGKAVAETNSGDVFYMPAGCDYKADYPEDNDILAVHFESDIQSNMENFKLNNPHIISSLFYKLLDIWDKKEYGYYYCAMSVMCEILKNITDQQYSRPCNETTKAFDDAVSLLENNFTDRSLSIKTLVENAHMSNTYFTKLFYDKFNTTPKKYLSDKRLMYADRLLSSGSYSVKEVAELSGFSDEKYFSRVVKKEFGISPSRLYRHIK